MLLICCEIPPKMTFSNICKKVVNIKQLGFLAMTQGIKDISATLVATIIKYVLVIWQDRNR